MTTFKFFVRNIVLTKRINADFIYNIIDGEEAKQTPFIAYSDKAPVAKAKELAAVAHHEKLGGESSAAYFAALKAFMVMGYNTALTFTVDNNNNVTAH